MQRDALTLRTTQAQFEGLHERVDKTRSTSKSVTVDKDALTALLMDHSMMVRAFRDHGRVLQES
jgi:hypothetical protein